MKKIYAILLSGVIVTASIPLGGSPLVSASADILPISVKDEMIGVETKDPTNEGLESAIKAVKARITIPEEYSEFEYYFYNANSYLDSYWRLTWRNPEDNSYIQVRCDLNNHITYYRENDYSEKYNSIPTYLKKELKETADQFLKQILPEISYKLEYVDADYEGIYNGNYKYTYQRKEKGAVVVPDNSVSVSVNSVTGVVKRATINWLYDVSVPSAQAELTKEEATELIKDNMTMELVYRTGYSYSSSEDKNVKKAFLVYQPSERYISVDAKTGEIYLTKSEWVEDSNSDSDRATAYANGVAMDTAVEEKEAEASMKLTDEETAKIEELKNLISKEKAIKAVTNNSYLYIDKNLTAYSATLNKSYGNSDSSYVWDIQLNDPRKVDYEKGEDNYRGYASAQVDAKTGKILNFYASMKDLYDDSNNKWNTVEIPYDKEESQIRFEKFLKTQINQRFKNSKLVDLKDDYIAYYKNQETPVYGGYSYQYNRVNEDVVYPYNGIYGSVDGVTGKIYSYYSNWTEDITFESPTGAMTPEKAMDEYLSKDGYGLIYEIYKINQLNSDQEEKEDYYEMTNAYSVDYEIRLSYHPEISPYYISPFTGEQLTSNGEAYTKDEPYSYKDIQDTEENRDILLLADMNIGFEGEYFNPYMDITYGELIEILQSIGYGYNSVDDMKESHLITREELAYNFIVNLGLEKIAGLKGIYQTEYLDQYNINKKYLGAVALANGLDLTEAEANDYFYPKKNVTRSEAVHLILQFINVQREGILN